MEVTAAFCQAQVGRYKQLLLKQRAARIPVKREPACEKKLPKYFDTS